MINERDVYSRALIAFGSQAQAIQAIEEMSELSQVLCKFANAREYSNADLIGELADVQIMFEQICLVFENLIPDFKRSLREMKVNKLTGLIKVLDSLESEEIGF